MNVIPAALLRDLLPEVATPGPLVVHSQLFSFGIGEMPVLLPHEQLALAGIVRAIAPRCLVEFGTAQGQTTFLLAANSPADAVVTTIDLDPIHWDDYSLRCLRGDDQVGACYRRSPDAAKVVQLLRSAPDRDPIELAELRGRVDFILIDGDHRYDGVRRDSESAFALAKPDALFAWHDFYGFPEYVAQGPARRGVYPYLNELSAAGTLQLYNVAGTYLVLGRRAWGRNIPSVVHQPGAGPEAFGHQIQRLGRL